MTGNDARNATGPRPSAQGEALNVLFNTGNSASVYNNAVEALKKATEVIALTDVQQRVFGDGGQTEAKVVLNGERGTLAIKGKTITLESGEKHVLKKLVEMRTARLSDLKSQHDRPDRILKGLREKYPDLEPHIKLPGGRGKGGYSTTIIDDTSCQK